MLPSPVTISKEPEYTILKHPETGSLKRLFIRTVRINEARDFRIPITLKDTGCLWLFNKRALIDCGATDDFIDQKLFQKEKLETIELATLVPIYQSDGKKTSAGDITGFINFKMDYKCHKEVICMYITDLGDKDIFLGMTWL